MRGLARWRGLRRLFSVYPKGPHGAGLLLLRACLGVVTVLFPEPAGLIAQVGGAFLIAGFLTPIAALSTAVALALSIDGSPFHHADLAVLLLIGGCGAVALLGPGAWSADAWLFGRREIVIPRRP